MRDDYALYFDGVPPYSILYCMILQYPFGQSSQDDFNLGLKRAVPELVAERTPPPWHHSKLNQFTAPGFTCTRFTCTRFTYTPGFTDYQTHRMEPRLERIKNTAKEKPVITTPKSPPGPSF